VAGLAVVIGCSITLTACSGNGDSLARQACGHVDSSIALFKRSASDPDPTTSAALVKQAYLELRDALPLSAQAAEQNSRWQALMTDVAESNRVDESYLVPSLQDQCAVADSDNSVVPVPPPSVPPPASSGS
jgi:hypothetical protein